MKNKKQTKNFVKEAWLYTLEEELTEDEFIKKIGIKVLNKLKEYPYVSLILDNPDEPLLVGHTNGRIIALVMQSKGHKLWQTMEWKN